jgi:hypothetical protein
MARTALNKQAGDWLRAVREDEKRKRSAAAFVRELEEILKTPIAIGTLYGWERGDRTVPAAVLLAASEITARPVALDPDARKRLIDELLDELEGRRREREGEGE